MVQVDVSRAGGLTESRRIAQMAHQRNLPCVPHAFSTGVLLAASMQWVASIPNGSLVEYTVAESPLATGLTGTGLLKARPATKVEAEANALHPTLSYNGSNTCLALSPVFDLAFAFPGNDPAERLVHRRPGWLRAT